ncbi:MAG: ChbG/HpnK family deacetylase [Acidimicrobiaceae bacterium]|nr:ChbG/HpnK family deacetylase [Acidimicrobiaceae bacterium]MXW88438.1 ChbG/HpnK family deacetylase [Acidimicrobiaceae bacterium]MXY11123.1 ChbG/HpnK family deacetylase [Acidimicrobiaceae bacterium]MXZ65554.1 ChbG/HpnK family deacetylase [Acidimicrobiaceae bacterium]MYE57839.1 ChbG/HpnK family deacetylase [Acidimicrobiaceae bacterium]
MPPAAPAATRLVIHADDVGMNHGANRAFIELSRFGTITAGSVMVPCPWFSEIAEAAAGDDSLDCGVHLTLNSEMTHYRWGPITRPGASSGLLDSDGYLWPDVASVRRHAHPDAVEAEWRAQVERAQAAGIDVTHLDTHMGSALAPEWCDRYVALGIELQVPALITGALSAYGPMNHLAGAGHGPFREAVAEARSAGMPVFDEVLETDFKRPRDQPADYEAMLGGLDTDLVYCAFHPNAPGGAEIEVIEPAKFHVRTDEYELFGTTQWKEWLGSRPLTLTTMRELREVWRTPDS